MRFCILGRIGKQRWGGRPPRREAEAVAAGAEAVAAAAVAAEAEAEAVAAEVSTIMRVFHCGPSVRITHHLNA